MKTQKINFMNVSSSLSRSEMKKIMAGSGGSGEGGCYAGCSCIHGCQQAPSGLPGYKKCETTIRWDGCYICSHSGGSCTG